MPINLKGKASETTPIVPILFTAINMFNGMAIMKIIRNRYRSFLFIIKEEIANDFILTNFDWFDGLLSLTVIIDLINLS